MKQLLAKRPLYSTTSSGDATASDGSHNGTSKSDSNGSLVDQIKDTISNIKDNVTGNDPEFSGDDFYATNQVVHFVPYRVQVIAPELAIGKTSDKKEYTVGETGHYNVEVVQTTLLLRTSMLLISWTKLAQRSRRTASKFTMVKES